MQHECSQDERIRGIMSRLDKVEEKVSGIADSLKDIKNFQNKLVYLSFTTLIASVGSLVTILFNLLAK